MAKSPEEIQKQLERIAKLYQQLGEKNPFAKMDPAKISASTDEVKKLEIAIVGATTAVTAMNAEVDDIRSAFMATVGEIKKTTVGLNMSTRVFRDFGSIAQQIKYDQEGIVDLTEKDVKALREKFNITLSNLEASKGQLESDRQNLLDRQAAGENVNKQLEKNRLAQNAINAEYKNEIGNVALLNEKLKETEKIQEDTGKNMGTFGKSVGGLGDVLDKVGGGKFGKMLGIEDAMKAGTKEAKGLAKAGKAGDIGSKFKVANKMIGTMAKSLAKALGPIAIIAELVKGMMQADEQTKELGRSMVMTKNESRKFSANISAATRSNYQMGITGTKVLENITKVNKQFGFITEFSGETLVSMTKLTYTLKIGEEAAGNLAAAAEATGQNFEDNYKNILAASYELQQQAGTQVDLRAVLEETGKVTGQIRANFGGSTVEIAKAVTNARLLGTEMGTIAAAGKQLLDFESSITKEMEAEMLLGRDINLERARAAALTGDQVTLQNELAREMGSFEDFTKMNVIQQEALAGAMGMSADQIADMLFNQETMNKSAKELRALGKDELANRLEQKSAQDKMNAAMAELKQVFVDLGTALSPILNVLSVAAGIISTIVGFTQDLLGFLNPFGDSFGKVDFESSAGVGAAKGLGKSIGIEDGVIGPSGDIITTSPEDFLIATKDPQQMASNVTQAGSSVDTSKLERLLEASLNKKPPAPVIKMNDVKLGTAVDMGAFSIQ
jgi:hypothetical protein